MINPNALDYHGYETQQIAEMEGFLKIKDWKATPYGDVPILKGTFRGDINDLKEEFAGTIVTKSSNLIKFVPNGYPSSHYCPLHRLCSFGKDITIQPVSKTSV